MTWAPLRIKILDLDHMHTLPILCNTNEIDDHLIVEQTSTILLLPTNMNRKSLKSTTDRNYKRVYTEHKVDCSSNVVKNNNSRLPRKSKLKNWQDYIVDEEGNFGLFSG
jgi:hypothetical protein